MISYEFGYRIKTTRSSLIDIATFYNDYNQLRTFDTLNGVPTAQNLGEGKSYGAEITAKWQAMDDWRLEAGYDFLKLDLKTRAGSSDNSPSFKLSNGEGQSPTGQFRIRSNYNITPKIEFDNIYYYVDSLPLSGNTTTPFAGVPSYARFDTRLGYLFNSHLDFSVGVQNLFNKKHQEFGEGLFSNKTEVGRTIYFKTAVRF